MINIAKNPPGDPYRKQLTNEVMDSIINNAGKPPRSLEKKVYYSQMCRRYKDQITYRVEQRADAMKNMADALKWKTFTMEKLHQYEPPVPGYEFNETKATLESTANLHSFRMSRGMAHTGTIETTSRVKRYLGYAVALLIAIGVLYGGYRLRKAGLEALNALDANMTKTEQNRITRMNNVADPNR